MGNRIREILEQREAERFNPAQAARYLGTKSATLAYWRCTGRYNLKYYKVGSMVYYLKADLDAFLERRAVGGDHVPDARRRSALDFPADIEM